MIIKAAYQKCLLLILLIPMLTVGQDIKASLSTLSARQKAIVLTSTFTANGDLEKLKDALRNALDSKLTVNEIKEVIVHVYAYCGFPRSIRGLNTLMSVLEERNAEGIKDEPGRDASPTQVNINKYEVGKKTLEKLSGVPQGPLSGYGAFSPEIDRFLKEHLFADIFGRDILSYSDRELATVAALISIGNVEPMMNSHMRISIYQGISEAQLSELKTKIEKSGSNSGTESARKVLAEISGIKQTSNTASGASSWQPIFPKGQRNPNPNMTGTVWLNNLVEQDSLNKTQVGNVTFEPSARTDWHSHFAGQILLVTDGTGYHQIKGKPVELIKKGDVIKCPPNVEHWHGATQTSSMTHIAITQNTDKGRVTWLGKVSDVDYNSYLEKNK